MSSAPQPASRFPLSLEVVEPALATIGSFDATQMDLVTASNAQLGMPHAPLDHVWNFAEDEVLRRLTRYERPPYPEGSRWRPVRRYRAAACVGDILVRGQEAALAEKGTMLEPVLLDPRRRYLSLPEEPTLGNIRAYRNEQRDGNLADRYLGQAIHSGYLAERDAVEVVAALRESWGGKDFGLLADGLSGPQPTTEHADMHFGEVCRAIFQVFRLYRIGEREGRLAPWSETAFNSRRHFYIDDAPIDLERTNERFLHHFIVGQRRWLPGVRLAGDASAATELGRRSAEDGAFVPYGAGIVGVQRCLTGYAVEVSRPWLAREVVFRRSLQQFELTPEDVLILRCEDERTAADKIDPAEFALLRWPFVHGEPHKKAVSVTALCRSGRIIQLEEGAYWPSEVTRMMDAFEEALANPVNA